MNKNYNSFEIPKDEVILDRLQEQLMDVYKDIELNYRRVYFKNPVINVLLKTMSVSIKAFAESLDFPEKIEHSDTPYTKKDKFTFGISRKDLT
jgi:hypothetical protein